MTEVKGIGSTRTQFLDDFRNGRRHRELKEKAEDHKKLATAVYRSNIRRKYKLSSIKSMDLLISSILNNDSNVPKI